jgi:chlorobactene glucosyltransferase
MLYIITAILIIFLFTLCINVAFGPRLKKIYFKFKPVPVSVMVPARNEQKNIDNCLQSLRAQEYPDYEIIVLDDNSEDRTADIVTKHAQEDKRIKLICGLPLEHGWTGKNWACHQLAQHARGDFFIFTDADTKHASYAISNTIAWIQKYKLDMLSAFPQQITITFSEKLIVPFIDFILYSLLPLWATYFFKSPAFSAANGQWIAFTRECYNDIDGHAAVRDQVVEDIELNRQAKIKGRRTLTLAGTDTVFCRMYHSASEVWYGFTKNFFGLTAHNKYVFIFMEIALFCCCILPYIMIVFYPTFWLIHLMLIFNLLLRLVLALNLKHPFLISVLLHPVSIAYALTIGFNSYYQFYWGKFIWKERFISIKN